MPRSLSPINAHKFCIDVFSSHSHPPLSPFLSFLPFDMTFLFAIPPGSDFHAIHRAPESNTYECDLARSVSLSVGLRCQMWRKRERESKSALLRNDTTSHRIH